MNNRNVNTCPMHGPGENKNLCKVIQAQDEYLKATRFSFCRRLVCVNFVSNKKHSSDGKQLENAIASTVAKALKIR